MAKETLEQRVIAHLTKVKVNSIDLWSLANALYDNCMSKPQPGNGARIANLRRAAEKSEKLYYYVSHTNEARVFLSKKPV